MNPILRNILGVIAGLFAGSIVNSAIIMIAPNIIPLPTGVNPMDVESLKENIHLFETKHFLFPFLAHALGTLSGALITVKIVTKSKMLFAMIIGAFFFLGGLSNVFMLPAPMWFNITDLILAYIPMAYLGSVLGRKNK